MEVFTFILSVHVVELCIAVPNWCCGWTCKCNEVKIIINDFSNLPTWPIMGDVSAWGTNAQFVLSYSDIDDSEKLFCYKMFLFGENLEENFYIGILE